jgi:stage II sporulation SpoAA-like protein
MQSAIIGNLRAPVLNSELITAYCFVFSKTLLLLSKFNQTKIMITPPENREVTEWPASTTWFDDDGIFYSVYKKGKARSIEETKQTIETFKKMLNGKKICMLVDVTYTAESSREIRDYAEQELPKFIKAIAMVSDSALGRMLANLFLTLKSQPYPTKMFNNEADAKEWLKGYL